MAYSLNRYPGDGVTTDFNFTFTPLDNAHIKVQLDGVIVSNWVIIAPNKVRITPAPAAGVDVVVYRATSPGQRLVDYEAPSSLNEADLDLDSLQAFNLCQEATDQAVYAQTVAIEASSKATQAQADVATAVSQAAAASSAANAANATAQDALQTAQDALEAVVPTTASDLAYDNSETGISATNIQDAIDVIASALGVTDITTDIVLNISSAAGVTLTEVLEGLLVSLNGKAALVHTHTAAQITDLGLLLDAKEPANANLLKRNASAQLTAGYSWSSSVPETITAGVCSPAFGTGNVKTLNNDQAFTLNAPATGFGVILMTVTNVTGAGVLTAVGFDKVDGDSFDTTVGSVFGLQIVCMPSFKMLVVTKK